MRAFALGWLAGVCWLQQQAALPALPVSVLLILIALAVVVSVCGFARSQSSFFQLSLLIATGIAFGFGWAALRAELRLDDALASALEGQDLVVTGTVVSLPDRVVRGVRFQFALEAAHTPDGTSVSVPRHISLGVYTDGAGEPPAIHPGQRWRWTVRLKRPHGNANPHGFDYEAWLLSEGVRATGSVRPGGQHKLDEFVVRFPTVIALAREALRDRMLMDLRGREYAGVIVALVVGDQRAVSQSDWEIFNRTGIGHLVSISGLHITMIAALFALLVNGLWRRAALTRLALPLWVPAQKAGAAAGVVAAMLYVALAGFGIPAQRTLIMLVVVAAALWTGRITAVSQVLCVALMLVLLLDPWAVLWPGFWLSFLAIACIFYVSAGRSGLSQGTSFMGRLGLHLRGAARTQYAITLGLVPLSLLLFGQVSLVGPVANALAIPLISFLVTPLSLLGSIAPAPLSGWVLVAAHALVAWLVDVLGWLAALPLAVWRAPLPTPLGFLLAAVGTLWLLAPRGWPLRWMGLLAWLPVLLSRSQSPAAGMWVTAFDIGQGNAVLIETATHRLLYDTGPGFSEESDSGNRVLVPYLQARGITRLDGLVVSHSDSDHAGGALSVLRSVEVGWVSSSLPPDHAIVQRSASHQVCMSGQSWVWDGVTFEMLQPFAQTYAWSGLRPNARSCVLKVRFNGQSVLLAGDIEAAQERALVERMPDRLRASVLLAPHHGSGTSSTPAFLAAVQPQIAVFQVGYRNRYRHPKAEVFERYGEFGIERLRTDESGAIRFGFGHAPLTVNQHRIDARRYWHRR